MDACLSGKFNQSPSGADIVIPEFFYLDDFGIIGDIKPIKERTAYLYSLEFND